MLAIGRPAISKVCTFWITLSFTILTSCNLVKEIEAVQGCSVFFQPDFKWKRALCDSENPRLTAIPTDLPLILVDLRITHQAITQLVNNGLRHLVHLQNLYIESSGLRHTSVDAFHGLTNLKQLNLRNNSLKLGIGGLSREALFNLPNLEWLSLAENPIDLVPDSYFKTPGGRRLRKLQVNSVKHVALRFEQDSLAGLEGLQHLDISYSGVTEFPSSLEANLNVMTDLKEFYFGGNPWNCDCELRWLRTWIIRRHHLYDLQYIGTKVHPDGRTVQLEPICFTPNHMKGQRLVPQSRESPGFHCPPKSITQNSNLSIERGTSYVLSCEFYSDQSSGNSVAWYRNGQLIYNDTNVRSRLFLHSGERSTDPRYISIPLDDGTVVSHLNYTYLDPVQDRGEWTCQLSTPGGHFEFIGAIFHITVITGDRPVADASGQVVVGLTTNQWNWIYAAIGVVLLFLLLAGIGVVIFYCCDPRTRSDHLFYRNLSKDRTGCASPPLGCRSCQKSMEPKVNSTTPDETATSSKVNTEVKSSRKGKPQVIVNGVTEIDGEDTRDRLGSVKREAADGYLQSGITGIDSITLPTTSFAGVLPNTFDTAALFVRTVGTGAESGRLIVSCDGPEQTVLLAAAAGNHPANESPGSAVYALPATLRHVKTRPGCVEYQPMGYQATSLIPANQAIPINTTSRIGLPSASFEKPQPSVVSQSLPFPGYVQQTATCPVHGNISLDTIKKGSKEVDYQSSPEGVYPKMSITPQPSGATTATNDFDQASVTTLRSSSSTSRTPKFTPPTRILPPQTTSSLSMQDQRPVNLGGSLPRPYSQIPGDFTKKSALKQSNHCNPEPESSSSHHSTRPLDLNQTNLVTRQTVRPREHHSSSKGKEYFYRMDEAGRQAGDMPEEEYDEDDVDSSTTWNSSKPSISTDSNTPPEYGPPELDTSSPSHCSWHHPIPSLPYPVSAQTRMSSRHFQLKAPPFVRAQSQVIPFIGSSPRTNGRPGAHRYFSTLPSQLRRPTVSLSPNELVYRSQTELCPAPRAGFGSQAGRGSQPSVALIRPGSKHKLETDSEDDDDDGGEADTCRHLSAARLPPSV